MTCRVAGGPVRTRRPGLSRDGKLLIAGQGVRAAGYGFTAVLLGALLAARGYTSLQAGVVLTALIAGTALASVAVGALADRIGRRRCYAGVFAGVSVAGVGGGAGGPLWGLLAGAGIGAPWGGWGGYGPPTPPGAGEGAPRGGRPRWGGRR